MPRAKVLQRSFDGGAWGRALFARSDHPAYGSASALMRNMIPRVSGPARRRPGTLFIAGTKDPTARSRLIPVIVAEDTAYQIELGHLYARFYRQDERIEVAGVPVEIATPWTEDEISEIQFAHDADTLVVTHQNHQPRLIQRVSDTNWTISALAFTYGPYLNRNEVMPNVIARQTGTIFPAKLQISGGQQSWRGATGSRTVTANGDVFDVTRDIGRLIVVGDGEDDPTSTEGFSVGYITAVASTTSATVSFFDGIVNEVGGAGPQKSSLNWWMQAYFEGTAIKRWPSSCTFFQERLWLGGGETGQDLLYGSRIGSLDDFDTWSYSDIDPPAAGAGDNTDQHTILDSSGIQLELSYPEVHRLRWMRGSRRTLVCGTSRAVFVVSPPADAGFSPLSALLVSPTAAAGSHTLAAVAVSERLHFVSSDRSHLTRIAYSLEADAFVPADMTLFNPEILQPGAQDIAVSYSPDPVIWIACEDGRLAGLTVDEGQRVIAWHDHLLGGLGMDQDYAEVESVSVIPSAGTPRQDSLWMIVRRRINGVEARFVERMDRYLLETDGEMDQRFVDARGPAYSGAAATVYAVGTHLIGETVDVLANGGSDAPLVVDGAGQITLATPAENIVAGLPQTARWRSLPLVIETRDGNSAGDTQRAARAIIRLLRSLGGRIGAGAPDSITTHPIEYRTTEVPVGEPPPLFSGLLTQPLLGESTLELSLELVISGPLAFELCAIGAIFDSSDS